MGNTFSSPPAWIAASTNAAAGLTPPRPEDLHDGAALVFVIDVTGSMGQWIAAVNATLPSLVRSVAITDVFSKMAILEYSDYDQPVQRVCGFSKWCETSNAADVAALAKFAKDMTPRGGGGAPEAFKSALYQLVTEAASVANMSRVHVLHLTDAPPHCGSNLDAEGKKEKTTLGDGFEWGKVVLNVLAHLPTVRYTALTSSPHALYADLAARTGGSVHVLQGGVTASNIRMEISRIMNGWLGFAEAHETQSIAATEINVETAPPTESVIDALRVQTVQRSMDACRVLKPRVSRAVLRLRKDVTFRVPALNALAEILDVDPMALTVSPVVGKLWREMCKMRYDERRDELIERLSKSKAKLAANDREVLEKWLRESYDAKAEIDEQLRAWMKQHATKGLLRFVPEDDSLCAQQVVQLLARNDKQATGILRAILSRMWVDTTTEFALLSEVPAVRHVDPVAVAAARSPEDSDAEDEVALPLPLGTIPLNMTPENVMMLAMHTVAPGTKLSRRYAALLAMHAILCGSVLAPVAREFLLSVKGKWINWRRRESDNSPEIPENFASAFVQLLLHPSIVDMVTDEEVKMATFLKRIFWALRFYHTELTVQTVDGTSADGKFPDHTMLCESCNKLRPLSIMSEDGKCGYCVENRADDVPACNEESQLQVRCYTCGSFYARNGAVNIPGHSKCHGCHRLGKPSPALECRKCHLMIVQCYNREVGLPKGGVCGPCAHDMAPRVVTMKDHVAHAHQLMDAVAFTRLCATVGLGPVAPATTLNLFSVGICDAVLLVRDMEPVPLAADEVVPVTFRNSTPTNAAAVVAEMQQVMAGVAQPQRAECALCFSDETQLAPACGRKGCDQRVCRACAIGWYGKNVPGQKLYERALFCQFCARTPAPNVLRAVAPRLLGVSMRARHMDINPMEFHAWCERCDNIEVVGGRDCAELAGGDAQQDLRHFLCTTCVNRNGNGGAAATAMKECPGCTVMVEKVDGCDHITCTNCGQHWCWRCRAAFTNADEVYDHMYSFHDGDGDEDEA